MPPTELPVKKTQKKNNLEYKISPPTKKEVKLILSKLTFLFFATIWFVSVYQVWRNYGTAEVSYYLRLSGICAVIIYICYQVTFFSAKLHKIRKWYRIRKKK